MAILWVIFLFLISWSKKIRTAGEAAETSHISRPATIKNEIIQNNGKSFELAFLVL